jgi:hypothetical protein
MERGGETDTLRIGFQAYVLPLGAWEALLGTRQLYYRLVTQSEGMATGPVYVMELTGDAVVSTNDREAALRSDEMLWRMPREFRRLP